MAYKQTTLFFFLHGKNVVLEKNVVLDYHKINNLIKSLIIK